MSKAISKSQLKVITKAINKHYPSSYADSSWDNTGLLIDCSKNENVTTEVKKPLVLLTVDLTSSVAQEAIERDCNVILAYHPFIFPSWKNLNPSRNSQHDSAIKLIQQGISVYCPHTAVDAAKDGVNDWLSHGLVAHERTMIASSESIESIKDKPINGEDSTEVGYGRLVKLASPLTLKQVIKNVKNSLGIDHLQVASHYEPANHSIKTIALCAGSGSGVFRSLREDVDLYYTGELSHHEILKYKEMGKSVIICNHSNTERGYLREQMCHILKSEGVDCIVSENDKDPLNVV
ncbi:hypothetical protein HG535_0B02610 [Zygotorulaspora mrakii]|uniref:YbgI/family dinuclear metal center protein n=1 Tax=Zygotorulaspora mrakii TaxID=42260 RepID=A0A7H9B0A7_ZYGMR|nr:uncharacterized protein HG535_0B02610 [Zygotorulaspora mrakii]QLG71222.1 hypothetical protein HG535_0B02610 [Zygotorulaspora mrakii]